MSCKKKCHPKCECEKPKKDDCVSEPKCCQCKDGRDGRDGPPGPRGPAGPAGPTGPAGESEEPCIATAFNIDQRQVGNNTAVIFGIEGPVSGNITGPGVNGSTFVIEENGIYSFNFLIKLLGTTGPVNAIFGLTRNNVSIIGTNFSVNIGPSGGGTIVGFGAIELNATDQIRLVNLSGSPLFLDGAGLSNSVVNAELTLECVDTTAA